MMYSSERGGTEGETRVKVERTPFYAFGGLL